MAATATGKVRRVLDPTRDELMSCYRYTWLDGSHDRRYEGRERLGLFIHPWAAGMVGHALRHDTPLINGNARYPGMAADLKIAEFVPPRGSILGHWGFGRCLELEGHADDGWLLFSAALRPECRDQTWLHAAAIIASLHVFHCIVNHHEPAADAEARDDLHLLAVDVGVVRDRDRFPVYIGVTACPPLVAWIADRPHESRDVDSQKVMRQAYLLLSRDRSAGRINVYTRQPKWINFTAPGNACGLDPESYNARSCGEGYRLLPHNVDTPVQALTLLAGLASVSDRAYADGAGRSFNRKPWA